MEHLEKKQILKDILNVQEKILEKAKKIGRL